MVNAAPSFTLAPGTATVSLVSGATASETINVSAAGGFTAGITLSVSGLPAGVTASFATNPSTTSSVMRLNATSAASLGTTTVTVTGVSGSLMGSTSFTLVVSAAPGLSLSAAFPGVTLTAGSSAADAISVSGSNGFTGKVALTAAITSIPAGAQLLPIVTFGSTSPVTLSGAGPGTATLSISTTAATTSQLTYPFGIRASWGCSMLAGIFFAFVPRRRNKLMQFFSLLVGVTLISVGVSGCGGGSGSTVNAGKTGTTAGNYVITITATSGTVTTTTPVNLAVD